MISPIFSRISLLLFSLLCIQGNTQLSRSPREKRAAQCENPNGSRPIIGREHISLSHVCSGNTCLFIVCENGGNCIEDSTTIDCFRCQCLAGFAGKVCDTQLVITRKHLKLASPSSLSSSINTATACNPTCINGGTCMNNMCFCPPGFSDNFCQRRGISPLSHTSHASRSSYI